MARRLPHANGVEAGVEVNLAPLVDVVFLLLIFFIVNAGGLEETGVEVDLPRAARAEDLARSSLLVGLDAAGALTHEGRRLGEDGLSGLVASRQRGAPTPVVVVADEATPTGRLIRVMDLCRIAGAPDVKVATQAP